MMRALLGLAVVFLITALTSERPRVFACVQADLPPASAYTFCVVLITDLNILGYSDGVNWLRADTGAPV